MKSLQKFSKGHNCKHLVDCNPETICAAPHHGLTIYQVSAWSDVNCRRSSPETKKFTDRRTPYPVTSYVMFFKRAYNHDSSETTNDRIGKMLHNICISAVVMSLRWASRGPWVVFLFASRPNTSYQVSCQSAFRFWRGLTLILPFATVVALEGSANSKACHTYNIPHATIQSKCSHTGVNLLSYKQTENTKFQAAINFSTHFNKLIRLFWKKSP